MRSVPLILRLDVTGKAIGWKNWQEAVCLYAKDRVVWSIGEIELSFTGGISRLTGLQSKMSINSIIAVKGSDQHLTLNKTVPPLSNTELFLRDGHMCMYCGTQLPDHHPEEISIRISVVLLVSWEPSLQSIEAHDTLRRRHRVSLWAMNTFPTEVF